MPIKLPSFRSRRNAYPPDLWTKCPSCEEMLFNKQLDKVMRVCPSCGHHFRLSASMRLEQLLDPDSFEERDAGLQSVDPLGFVDQKPYPDRIAAAQIATGMRDAAVWGFGRIDGHRIATCVMDFAFMGGSMGSVVGEKVTRATEAAYDERVPLVIVSSSGGARMQEGTLALMQLAKTIAALERLRSVGVPFISVMTDPTTGGVFASYAVLGDVNLAEPNALIGFAGARVSAGTIAQELPPGFQRSEFLFEHGFVDRVVQRADVRSEVALLLRYLVPIHDETTDELEPAGLPSFRPLSFLSALAEKVIPDLEPETNGRYEEGSPVAGRDSASPEDVRAAGKPAKPDGLQPHVDAAIAGATEPVPASDLSQQVTAPPKAVAPRRHRLRPRTNISAPSVTAVEEPAPPEGTVDEEPGRG
jgi:acetyl-CoA carboxylase carboxyl transferase subunit beta